MLIFKCGFIVLPVTYITTLCFQIVQVPNYLNAGLVFLYVASGTIVTKIIYDRYKYVHILGALTSDPRVTSYSNNIASFSAIFMCLGVVVYLFLTFFEVDDRCFTALSIFICGFCTLYLWMQCIITTYIASLYFDQHVAILRQCLANGSLLVLFVATAFSVATSLLPRGASAIYVCTVITDLSSYTLAAVSCIFILSFEKDYHYVAEGLRPESLLDETCVSTASSTDNLLSTASSTDNLLRDQHPITTSHKGHNYCTMPS